ncbi:MAG: YihY/virulence factor BrkB family protein [Bacteroidia bacterium]|nr:YihY/virulence factor BrkB family protein [Bacteroidia bacterium]
MIFNKLLFLKPVKWLVKKASEISMPGTPEVSLYAVLEFFIRNMGKSELNLRASALAFNFFLALFPTVIFFFTLIAYLPLKYKPDEILFFIAQAIPPSTFETIKETLSDILKNQRSGLLSVGFISAMYFSTNGFHNLMDLLNKFNYENENRTFLKQRLVAIGLSLFATVLILVSVLMVTVGTVLISYLEKVKYFPGSTIPTLIAGFNMIVAGLIVLGIVSAIYYYAPARSRKLNFFSVGAISATLIILLTTYGFSQYINHFNSYNKLYGSIGALLVVMMLIYINTFILLLGYDVNVAIERALSQARKRNIQVSEENRIVFLEEINEESNK